MWNYYFGPHISILLLFDFLQQAVGLDLPTKQSDVPKGNFIVNHFEVARF
ncbi:hypothetical protein Syun_001809 [Stephania yunnanensis]|uniref:Uncharacterized protein n=1 Tax=Stephania yunnanensis TaxID=152371 RepID=A0AAP0LK92_9MAGN